MTAVRFFLYPIFFPVLVLVLFPLALSAASPEIESLFKLKQSFTGADKSLSSWIQNVSPCGNWVGVVCFKNVITGLRLSDLGLSGTIDIDALMKIQGLRTISFVNNSFSGPMPEFNKLGTIKSLYLTNNQFSGPIPSEYFSQLGSLKKVWLSSNKFSGKIPESLTGLELLKELHLEKNEFSGLIPQLKQQLTSFDVSNNKLEGPIPESFKDFKPDSFSGNEKLCGKPLDKACDASAVYALPAGTDNGGHGSSLGMQVFLLLILAIIAAVIFMFYKNKQQKVHQFSIISRSNSSIDVDQVQ